MNTIITNAWQFLVEFLQTLVSKLIVALVIILVGFIIGRIISKLTQKGLNEIQLNKIIRKLTSAKIPIEEIISYIIEYLIYFIAIVNALRHIGIATDILNILSAGLIILLIIIIFLGIKDFVPNSIAGIMIHYKKLLKEEDFIEVDKTVGKVVDISLVETRVITKKGDTIIIPNSNLTKNGFKKFGRKQF